MTWNSASDFFAMGGYGLYVWGAYGVTAACMLADPILAGRRHRRAVVRSGDDAEDDVNDATDATDATTRRIEATA